MAEDTMKAILIVDDDIGFIRFLVEHLKDEYTIFAAKNGHIAINMAMNNRPDLILMDVNMPDMTGHEVLMALQFMPETKDIPIIFISGNDHPEIKETGLKIGAVDHIHKNMGIDAIKNSIKKQLCT